MQSIPESDARPARYPSLWVLVSWLTIFLVGTDLFIVSAFLPLMGRELHMPAASLTILVSAFSLTYALACPIQGRVAERWGLRTVLVSGVVALGAANFYTAAATDLLHLTLSRVLAGFAAASISPMLYALAAERATPLQRASRLAQVNSGLVISLCLGAPLGLVVGDITNWRSVFMGLATILLIMVPFNAAVWPPRTVRPPITQLDAINERLLDAWPLLVCMMAWSVSVYATYTLLATALSQDFAASAQEIALVLVCFGAGATAGVFAGGRLADRIGVGRQVRLSLVLMTVAFAFCQVAYRNNIH